MADDISVMAVLPAGGSGERFGSETPKQVSSSASTVTVILYFNL